MSFAKLHAKLSLPVQQKSPDPQNYHLFFLHKVKYREGGGREMMNILALGLVLTSLVTAGFFTPSPEGQKQKDDVIVKHGHRVVVVEYEKNDGNTKVLIAPQDSQTSHKVDVKGFASIVNDKLSERMEGVKEGIKEASSVLPDVKEVGNQEEGIHHRFRPRELVCDAYGKCKHKIASAIGRTSEAVAEKVSGVEEMAKEAASEAVGKIRDTVTHTSQKASDKVQEAKENVKDSATEVSSKTKEKLSEKASEVKEEASGKIEKTKEMVSEKAKEAEEWADSAFDSTKRVKKEGKKELSEIMHHAREVAVDVFDYMVPAERVAQLTGVLHLMGFAAAYGMCVWVTFASSQVLAGALPRQQFAMVQSKIYPVYFKAMAYSVGMALLGHLMSPRNSNSVGVFQGFNLMASLGTILVNLLYLEPRATKVMLERMTEEKEEGKGKGKEGSSTEQNVRVTPNSTAETAGRGSVTQEAAANSRIIRLSETLHRLNSYSSILNVMTLMSLTWHLVRLGAVCTQCVDVRV